MASVEKRRLETDRGEIGIYAGGGAESALTVCASHPAEAFGEGAAELLAAASGARVVCVSPGRPTLEEMVDDLEAVRRSLDLEKWVFWGMSGGGWLAQIYAHRYPDALAGIIVESACPCFRERLADPVCVLSPFFPAWRIALESAGLLDPESHREASPADDSEWIEIQNVGSVFHRRNGPALLVSPMAVSDGMRRVMPELWRFDSRAWLSTVRVPTLVLAGTADPVAPLAHVRAVHEAISGSRWVAVEGAGHVPVVERRPEVGEAVRSFLAGALC